MSEVDSLRPVAIRAREKGSFQPGIGPHPEDWVIEQCLAQLSRSRPLAYAMHAKGVRYGPGQRWKCDLCFGAPPLWDWAIEAKLLRFLGDNGKPNDNMLMHILSPYPNDRSALTDCVKLSGSGLARQNAILVFGYPSEEWPLEPAIEAFETLAATRVRLGPRLVADSGPLVHPVHSDGRVFGWEVF